MLENRNVNANIMNLENQLTKEKKKLCAAFSSFYFILFYFGTHFCPALRRQKQVDIFKLEASLYTEKAPGQPAILRDCLKKQKPQRQQTNKQIKIPEYNLTCNHDV